MKPRIVDSKMIVVESRGQVMSGRGLITTPITRPYRETCSNIWNMITKDRAKVAEVLSDGSKVYLSAQNFNTNNDQAVAEAKQVTNGAVAPVTVSAPTGTKKEFETPQCADDKATERFMNNSIFKESMPAPGPENNDVDEEAGGVGTTDEERAGTRFTNVHGKKNKKNRNRGNNWYDQQSATYTNNQQEAAPVTEAPKADMSVGLESV